MQAQSTQKHIAKLQNHPFLLGFPAKSLPCGQRRLLHMVVTTQLHHVGLVGGPISVKEYPREHAVPSPGASLSLGNPGHAQSARELPKRPRLHQRAVG